MVLVESAYAALCYVVYKTITGLHRLTIKENVLPKPPRALIFNDVSKVDVLRKYYVTTHDLALYIRKWLPHPSTQPRGVVFLVHGLGEHGGRYEHIARALAKAGFAVFSVDHQGHGLSDGERMYARKLVHLAEDYLEFVNHVLHGPSSGTTKNTSPVVDPDLDPHAEVNWDSLPRFVFGHSMGGAITCLIAELSAQSGLEWNGVILSSPALFCAPWAKSPRAVERFGVIANLFPKATLPSLEFHMLGDDRDVFNRWVRDPLRALHGTTFQLGYQIVKEGARIANDETVLTTTFKTPLYVIHGEKDEVTFPKGSVKLYTRCSSPDKTLKVVPGKVHEVFNLEGHEDALQEIIVWIEKHT